MRTIKVTRTFVDRGRESQEIEVDQWDFQDALKICRMVTGAMDRVTIKSISFENLDREWMRDTTTKYKKTNVHIVSRNSKGVIRVPKYINIPDALRIFNIGYGRALAHAIRYIREHFPEHEETLKKELLTEVDEYNVYVGGDK